MWVLHDVTVDMFGCMEPSWVMPIFFNLAGDASLVTALPSLKNYCNHLAHASCMHDQLHWAVAMFLEEALLYFTYYIQ